MNLTLRYKDLTNTYFVYLLQLTSEDTNRTLEELKLCPQETLILEERT